MVTTRSPEYLHRINKLKAKVSKPQEQNSKLAIMKITKGKNVTP